MVVIQAVRRGEGRRKINAKLTAHYRSQNAKCTALERGTILGGSGSWYAEPDVYPVASLFHYLVSSQYIAGRKGESAIYAKTWGQRIAFWVNRPVDPKFTLFVWEFNDKQVFYINCRTLSIRISTMEKNGITTRVKLR